jgi:MFS family permease
MGRSAGPGAGVGAPVPGAGLAATLRRREVAPLVAASLLGRLPLGMGPLGLVLLLRAQHRSYAVAGAVVAAYSLGIAAANPLLGRAVDRYGEARVLLPLALAFPAFLGGVVACAQAGTPLAACAALAACAGAALPPLGACMRALWPRLVDAAELRSSAYAFEATVQEIGFVVGPLLVATIASALSPAAALVACAAAGSLGGGAFALLIGRTPPAAQPAREGSRRRGALRSRGVRTMLMASVGLGAAFGTLEVAMPAFAERHGSRAAAGVIVGMLALGSLLGGVWAARFPPRRGLLRRYLLSMLALEVVLAPLLLAPSIVAMALLALLAGAPIAPGFASSYSMLDELAVPGAATETFAWVGTTIVGGAAAGTALGGLLVHAGGYRAALALGLVTVGLAFVLTLARRHTLMAGSVPAPARRTGT